MSEYSQIQINAAKDNAALHGFDRSDVSDDLAVTFLDWYFSAKTEYSSVQEAIVAGLSGLVTNGVEQQIAFWDEHLISPKTINRRSIGM